MKYKFKSSIIGIGLVISIISVSGCTANRINRTNQLSVPLELVPSEDAYISRAYAYEDANEFVIYGKVKRRAQNCCDPARGHVDIAVLGPEGTILDVTSTLYSPHNIAIYQRSEAKRLVSQSDFNICRLMEQPLE